MTDVFKPLTLSKGRFLLALECPRKLDYLRDPRYYDAGVDNELLASLAEGGFQVGELARRMFPDGVLVAARSQAEQLRQTAELLQRPDVTIFEATVQFGNLLVRVDILEKKGNEVRLLEVKAKGFDPGEERFVTKRGDNPIVAEWRPYLYDVAFQTHVLERAHADLRITPHLVLLDKRRRVAFDGLNSMFAIELENNHRSVRVCEQFEVARLDPPLLTAFDVSKEVRALRAHAIEAPGLTDTFDGFISRVSDALAAGASFGVSLGAQCKSCQYHVDPAEQGPDRLSGWARCMEGIGRVPADTRRRDTVFGLFRFGGKKLTDHLASPASLRLADLEGPEIDDSYQALDEITHEHRRMLQLAEARGELTAPLILHRQMMLRFEQQPVHFLDFETARPALPYHRGRSAYDLILFQFSHHVLHADGRLEHRSQFLDTRPGSAPSVNALRALCRALSGDHGRVIHWSPYEASVLKEVRRQIDAAPPPDADELRCFIDSLVGTEDRPGRLFDLAKTVAACAFYPGTGGSSSIKRVLPAVLEHSALVRERFGKPIYGTVAMPSLNFRDWNWIRMRDGKVVDPYELLDPLLELPDLAAALAAAESEDSDAPGSFVANGGAALLAYDKLQRPDLPSAERESLERQLLRYCELDTLAMAMVFMSLA